MSFPRAPHRLPDEFAAALGHAVAGFGFLEEALKRTLHAVGHQSLGPDPTPDEVARWTERVDDIADDSLGTLISALAAMMKHARALPKDETLVTELLALKLQRNMLCHASWKPTDGPDWHPDFVQVGGAAFEGSLTPDDIDQIHDTTLSLARRVVAMMRATGQDGDWAGADE